MILLWWFGEFSYIGSDVKNVGFFESVKDVIVCYYGVEFVFGFYYVYCWNFYSKKKKSIKNFC